jgi:hypothetical protein
MAKIIFTTLNYLELEDLISNSVKETLKSQCIEDLVYNAVKKAMGIKASTEDNDFITRQETASILKISMVTLHHWTNKGLIKHYKISSRVRYKKSEVLKMLEDGSLVKYASVKKA